MKPRVLHLVDSFDRGGTELQALQLAMLLRESGHFDISLACLRGDGPLREEATRAGFTDIPEFRLTSFYNTQAVRQGARFRRLLRTRGMDLIHTHDFYTNVFGMVTAAAAGVRVRVASRRETLGMRSRAQRFVEKRAFDLATMVVANADAVREQLIAEGLSASKVVTIHNGLDAARYRMGPEWDERAWRAGAGLPLDRPLVTIVANLRHDVKNHPMFLEGARIVHERVPACAFVLAGEGPLLEPMRARADALGIGADTFFLGRYERVRELLSASAVCVLTSTAEGFSNSILEYLASAKPVVATDVGGARETIQEGRTGYLVPSGGVREFANRVTELLEHPATAREMGARGRDFVVEQFSLGARLRRTEELYDALLSGGRA